MYDLNARARCALRKWYIRECKRLGIPFECAIPNCTTGYELEVHHKDFNSKNNKWHNLTPLCVEHHNMEHGRVTWRLVILKGISLPLPPSSKLLDLLGLVNKDKRRMDMLKNLPDKYLRKAVRLALAKKPASGADERAGVVSGDMRSFLIDGVTIEVLGGQTVRYLGIIR